MTTRRGGDTPLAPEGPPPEPEQLVAELVAAVVEARTATTERIAAYAREMRARARLIELLTQLGVNVKTVDVSPTEGAS